MCLQAWLVVVFVGGSSKRHEPASEPLHIYVKFSFLTWVLSFFVFAGLGGGGVRGVFAQPQIRARLRTTAIFYKRVILN